ncbi:hypothetical protein F183_A14090 [Bryobacterales bacterium F-183]|nr:hypothetical protein F183_A14090 [Bryobacterales bacterium F-183]
MIQACLLCFPLLLAQEPRDLLEKVSAAARDQKNLHYTLRYESELIARQMTSKTLGATAYARDARGRVLLYSDDPGAPTVIAWDGTTIWRANPDTREYVVEASTESPVEKRPKDNFDSGSARLRTVNWTLERLTERLQAAERTGTEEIALADGRKVRCEVIRATYDPPPGMMSGATMELIVRTFWIDPERLLLWKEESVSRGNLFPSRPFEVGESRRRGVYTWHAFGTPIAAETFAWRPPAEFRQVDKLLPGYQRASLDMKGKAVPEVSLKPLTGEGEAVSLASLKGKTVLLDFWATWCAPCREQMPAIAKLAGVSGLTVIGINDDAEPEIARKYLAEKGYGWLNLYDGKDKRARELLKVNGIPSLILIDKEGLIQRVEIGHGESSEKAIQEAIRAQGIPIP